MRSLFVIFLALIFGGFTQAQEAQSEDATAAENPRRIYQTKKIKKELSPKIDGLLDEAIWEEVEWTGDFRVHQPNNGEDPTRETKFRILFDNDHIYFGFRCYDDNPSEIVNRLARRDNFPGDWIEVNIDSYFDKNTAFSFTGSVSGVKGDEFISNNGNNWDDNWNPIWYLASNIDQEGWTCEMKIPFSQLRFGQKDNHVWGFQVQRRDFRADERSTYQFRPQNASGWVSEFAELHGISGIKPKRQVELQPYVVGRLETFEKEDGNPFADGSDSGLNIGLDGKIGLTNDITLDFTINPDFGQVEADPSRLTLDGFQIFFNEQRPFFIENNNLFSFRLTQADAGGPFNSDNLFYSRRIGRRPQGGISVEDGAYVNRPDFTSILGSAKISGKTKNGWSIGLIESITAEEKAVIDIGGERSEAVVEPLTNYLVGRLSKDFNNGATTFGGTFTAVNRRLDGTGLEDQYHDQAYSGGLDLRHTWKDREWQLRANFVASQVTGTTDKILDTQESFEHYFQRPDADHIGVDPSLTSLNGTGGTITIANYWGEDNLSFQTGLTYRSPELELNDIGFMNTADEINYFFWGGYRLPKPTKTFRTAQVNYNHWSRWTTGGEHLYLAFNVNAFASFSNYWSGGFGSNVEVKDISQKALFGGPLLRRSKGHYKWLWFNNDSRKDVRFGANAGRFDAMGQDKGTVTVQDYSVWMSYQVTDAIRFSMSPGYFQQDRKIQNVGFFDFDDSERYLTGTLRQKTFSSSFRLNYSLGPNLTFQYWGQPFVSIGTYKDFKYITEPLAEVFTDRFHQYNAEEISFDSSEDRYYVSENGKNYDFGNPDFNFLEFRSNLVFRWEYIPGSELFLVWSQSAINFSDPTKGVFRSLTEDLFDEKANNTFLIKATYRFY